MNHSLRYLGVLCVSAVNTGGKPYRRDAEDAEIAQRVETRTPPDRGRILVNKHGRARMLRLMTRLGNPVINEKLFKN